MVRPQKNYLNKELVRKYNKKIHMYTHTYIQCVYSYVHVVRICTTCVSTNLPNKIIK